jgi:hypothetical protein
MNMHSMRHVAMLFSFIPFFLGGYLLYAWEYMANHGLASEDCIPYASGSGHPPACPITCADNRTITRTAALLSSVAYSGSATQLQNEILKNGPIQVFKKMNISYSLFYVLFCFLCNFSFQVGFDVYNDFFRFFLFCFSSCSVPHGWVFALEHIIAHSSREGGISAWRFNCFSIILLLAIIL